MKLLNQSLKYLSFSILFIISLWAVIFYFNLQDEIKESVDEGLAHYKRQIIFKVQKDSSILTQFNFNEGFYAIHEIDSGLAMTIHDRFIDTLMYMQDADDEEMELEPVRMLITAFKSKNQYYKLNIINPMMEEDDLMEELLWDIIGLYAILVIGIILTNNFLLQRLWKPFYNYLDQLQEYKLGRNKKLPEIESETKEFIDLKNTVNSFLQRSIATFDQQKQFIGNASHELQTPLAIVTNKLEWLLEKGKLNENEAESIAEIIDIINRLVRLNKSLLLLTKIENNQFLDNQMISINQIVMKNLDELEEIASYKLITISFTEIDELSILMDISLAQIIIINLVKNAIFHNIPKGVVEINISGSTLSVSNTGDGQPLNEEKIFTRFYKSDSSTRGTGLGLSIIKAICNLYGFSVEYHFENQKHYFIINFSIN